MTRVSGSLTQVRENCIFRPLGPQEILMSKYRIMLAEDHVMMREGLKRLIQEDRSLKVVGEANDGVELLDLLEESTPDMVILDLSMPRLPGSEAIRLIKGFYPKVKILVLTMHKEKDYLYQAMDNGADGYIIKEDAHDVLHTAIEAIRQGEKFISPLIFG